MIVRIRVLFSSWEGMIDIMVVIDSFGRLTRVSWPLRSVTTIISIMIGIKIVTTVIDRLTRVS